MTEPIGARRVFTVEEAAEELCVARATLYRLVKQMKVPHRRIAGTGVRFTQADIDEILEGAYRPAVA